MRRLLLVGLACVVVLGFTGCGDDVAPNKDSGVTEDAGDQDAGEQDAGEQDAGEQDAGEQDAGEQDAGEQDAGGQDAGEEDGGQVDAGGQDAGEEDAGETDGGQEDGGVEDGGELDGGADEDDQCLSDADCDDSNPCTDDTCDTTDGTCSNAAVAAGTPCDDGSGNYCNSTCSAAGTCDGGSVICDDSEECTIDSCDPADGSCSHAPVVVDTPCDNDDGDGDYCNSTCNGLGACIEGVPVYCDDGQECTHNLCDSANGSCSYPLVDLGTPCNGGDDNYCNSTCSAAGTCEGPAVSCDDSQECTDDSCDITDGTCSSTPKPIGTPCNDGGGNYCNFTCSVAGACDGPAVSCDDSQECTDDTCDAADGTCTNTAKPVGTPCNGGDNDFCNSTCSAAGACNGGSVNCDDLEECTIDGCEIATGLCTNQPQVVGTPCDGGDNDFCNSSCSAAGACDGGPVVCNDMQECTSDDCDTTSGNCLYTPLALDTPCAGDDSDYCDSTCDGAGICVEGAAVSCDDGLECTHNLCDGASGLCSYPPAALGTPCNGGDNDFCNSTCDGSGSCDSFAAVTCDDSQECTNDSCDSASGNCQYTPVALGTPCNGGDDDYCNSTCSAAGTCDGTVPVDCDDLQECTTDSCNPASGTCSSITLPFGTPCNGGDGNYCNSTCAAGGTCGSTPVDCDDLQECTNDGCNTANGDCTNIPVAAGTPCDGGDGNFCNSVCSAGGTCGAGTITCDDSEECTSDSCNTANGSCQYVPVAAGTPCNGGDGNYCNSTCLAAGTCTGGAVTCNDAKECTTDSCDITDGDCVFTPVVVGTPCAGVDSNVCNSTCDAAGDCDETAPLVCDDGVFCNGTESCNPATGCQPGSNPCDDGIPCTLNDCLEASSSCDNFADHTVCDNGVYCDGAEQCNPSDPGADPVGCVNALPVDCGDNPDPCLTSVCTEIPQGCQDVPTDEDGDTHYPDFCTGGDDCDDQNPNTYPGAPEICDAEDNDCDTDIDENLMGFGESCASDADCCSANCVNLLCDFPAGACLPPFYQCASAAECCSGVCGPDVAGISRCQTDSICLPTGAACTWSIECCSMSCQAGLCATGSLCAPAGAGCVSDEDCCENYCNAGTCESTGGFCTTLGELCSSPGNCCSNVCTEVAPGESRCNFYAECRNEGDHCTIDDDCCNCMCESDGLCGSPGACSTVFEACTGGGECCSGLCVPEPSGTEICRFISGCISEGELCDPTCPRTCAKCCSGNCVTKTTGGLTTSRCEVGLPPNNNCLGDGNICGATNSKCCDGDAAQCRLTRTGITRCWGPVLPGECLGDGSPCDFSDQCCSEYCIPDSSGDLFCQAGCSQLDEPCTASADCCADPVILKCEDCACVESDLPCVDVGMPCNTTDECCYGVCDDGYCLVF